MQNSCAFQLEHPKSMQSSRTLFESGEMAVTLPTAALSPPFRALGMSLHAKLLQLAVSSPRVHLCFFSFFELHHRFPRQKVRGITLAWDPLYPYWDVKLFFYLENEVDLGPLGPSRLLQTLLLSPVKECGRDYWKIELFFDLEYDVNHFVTVFVCWPALEEGTSHCLTVSEQDDTTSSDQLTPDSHGREYCHHFKLLDDSFLPFGHYII